MAGNYHRVLIFIIIAVDLAIMKISINTCRVPVHMEVINVVAWAKNIVDALPLVLSNDRW